MADATIRMERIHNLKLSEPKSKPFLRGKFGDILSFIVKFAFDSTIIPSLKVSTGGKQVNKIEQEELKDQPFTLPFNDKNKLRDPKLVMEKMQEDMNNVRQQHKISASCVEESEAVKKITDEDLQAKMEKMQEDMNDVKQQLKISTKCVEESESSKKKPEEDMKGYDLLQNNRKGVFIRSRL